MKYKVLLIDDEPIIRKGLKNIINWEQFNCEVCGEAQDGYEGLTMIEKHSPDIVFTDIKMPEMSGLEMLDEINQAQNNMKFIVLTGFRDFEYVKEALILGAFDFLLKPTKLADIKKVVARAVNELDMQKGKSEIIARLEKRYEKNLPLLREKLLYDIMMGIVTDAEEIKSESGNVGIDVRKFIMLLACAEDEGQQVLHYGIMHTFSEMLGEEYNVLPVGISSKDSAFIVELPKDCEILYGKCLQLQKMMKESFDMHISIAVSEPAEGLEKILMCYSQCKKAIGLKEILGEDAFILYSDVKEDALKYTDAKLMGMGRIIIESLSLGVEASDAACINNLEAELKRRDSVGAKEKEIILAIIKSMLEVAPLENYSPDTSDDVYSLIGNMRKIYAQAASRSVKSSQNNMKLILKKAVDFLEMNYYKAITLRQVADAVYVSPFYISRMFSRQLGKTMTEYLNDIRIKNACELLKDVEYKVYQVGEMVGIPDAHYFSRIFKKQMSVTPTDYRNNII